MTSDQIQIILQVLDQVLGAFVKAIPQNSSYSRQMADAYHNYKREFGKPEPEKSFVIGVCLLAAGKLNTAREALQDALGYFQLNLYKADDPVSRCYEYLVWTYASHLREHPEDAVRNISIDDMESAIAHFQSRLQKLANEKETLEKAKSLTDYEIKYKLKGIEAEKRSNSYLYAMANEAAVRWMRANEDPSIRGRTDRNTREECFRKAKKFYEDAGCTPDWFNRLRIAEREDD